MTHIFQPSTYLQYTEGPIYSFLLIHLYLHCLFFFVLIIAMLFSSQIAPLYLAGVPAALLQRHLLNTNVIDWI